VNASAWKMRQTIHPATAKTTIVPSSSIKPPPAR